MMIFLTILVALLFWWHCGAYALMVYTDYFSEMQAAEDLKPHEHLLNLAALLIDLTTWPTVFVGLGDDDDIDGQGQN